MNYYRDIMQLIGTGIDAIGVLILALIVIIRTFLSMALQLEVEGRWPWQRGDDARSA